MGSRIRLRWIALLVRELPVAEIGFDSPSPLTVRKVAEYGWSGRFAKPCARKSGMWVRIPCLPLGASMVKWMITSRF